MWEKIKRYVESLKNKKNPDIAHDVKAIVSGMTNFVTGSRKWNDIARERYEKSCKGCPFFIDDPVPSERVTDKHIPELSGKICSNCGCVESYKLRQSVKLCEFWK